MQALATAQSDFAQIKTAMNHSTRNDDPVNAATDIFLDSAMAFK